VPRAVAAPPPAATTRAVAAPPPAATTRAVAAPPPAATTRAVAAAIDVATLEAVAGPLSDAATRDYLTGFREEMEPILGALAAAVAAGDAEDAAMRAHAARGAAANVGASVLVAACAAVEDEIRRRGSAAGVARVHGDVAPAWRAVRARLGELLAAQREDAR
jgi:HPt (histidine-containing phosphotransfer) domain-containing protein